VKDADDIRALVCHAREHGLSHPIWIFGKRNYLPKNKNAQ